MAPLTLDVMIIRGSVVHPVFCMVLIKGSDLVCLCLRAWSGYMSWNTHTPYTFANRSRKNIFLLRRYIAGFFWAHWLTALFCSFETTWGQPFYGFLCHNTGPISSIKLWWLRGPFGFQPGACNAGISKYLVREPIYLTTNCPFSFSFRYIGRWVRAIRFACFFHASPQLLPIWFYTTQQNGMCVALANLRWSICKKNGLKIGPLLI